MKLDLIKSPNEWLQKKIEPMDVNNIPKNIVEIKNEMDRVMKENKGIGLSANQVGLDYRLFIFHAESLQNISAERVNMCCLLYTSPSPRDS